MKILLLATVYKNDKEVQKWIRHVQALPKPQDIKVEFSIHGLPLSDYTNDELQSITFTHETINKGYLSNCNIALEKYLESNSETPKWIAVSNTDLEFKDDFFELFPTEATNYCIAPNIRMSHDNSPQNPFMVTRPTKTKQLVMDIISRSKNLFRLFVSTHKFRSPKRSSINENFPDTAYAPHGSCFFLKSDFFLKGNINYPCFMYCEELFIAEQLVRQKQNVLYAKDLLIKHYCGETTSLCPSTNRIRWQMESWQYVLNRFFKS